MTFVVINRGLVLRRVVRNCETYTETGQDTVRDPTHGPERGDKGEGVGERRGREKRRERVRQQVMKIPARRPASFSSGQRSGHESRGSEWSSASRMPACRVRSIPESISVEGEREYSDIAVSLGRSLSGHFTEPGRAYTVSFSSSLSICTLSDRMSCSCTPGSPRCASALRVTCKVILVSDREIPGY